ncbi:hypothetical protein JB92DRAFT_3143936, partial [Gautieria morchelliformis]
MTDSLDLTDVFDLTKAFDLHPRAKRGYPPNAAHDAHSLPPAITLSHRAPSVLLSYYRFLSQKLLIHWQDYTSQLLFTLPVGLPAFCSAVPWIYIPSLISLRPDYTSQLLFTLPVGVCLHSVPWIYPPSLISLRLHLSAPLHSACGCLPAFCSAVPWVCFSLVIWPFKVYFGFFSSLLRPFSSQIYFQASYSFGPPTGLPVIVPLVYLVVLYVFFRLDLTSSFQICSSGCHS